MPRRLTTTQRRLLKWSDAQGRDLPWRATRDPWAILVSEVMLQQTQVARVIPVWAAFLERFPTPAACACSTQADAVTAWHGMGYNRRAVLVFAFEQHMGVVDVNAARVHARLEGRALTNAEVQLRADDATPPTRPWQWNQAVLDLGATVCTKRAPKCGECPLTADCGWRVVGYTAPHPDDNSARIPKRQSIFEGSDRQGRGRLVSALRSGPVSPDPASLAEVMGWPDDPDRSVRVALTVVADGLAKWEQPAEALRLQ